MKKTRYDYRQPLPDIWSGDVAALTRAIGFFGKKPSPDSLRLELGRYGNNPDGVIYVLGRYDISAALVSAPSQNLAESAPCLLLTEKGLIFLESVKNDRFSVVLRDGKTSLSRGEIDSVYLGKALSLKPSEGFNLAGKPAFDTLATFSGTAKTEKLRVFVQNFCCAAAIFFTTALTCVIKAYLTEGVFGGANVRGGAEGLFFGIFAALAVTAVVMFETRTTVSRRLCSAITGLASLRADKADPAIYSYESKKLTLERFDKSAKTCSNLFTSRIYALWCLIAAAVFCALAFIIDPLCALPLGIAAALLLASAVIAVFPRKASLAVLIVSISSYAAVGGVVGISAFSLSGGLSSGNAAALVIYSLLYAFSSVFAIKTLVGDDKMRLAATVTDSFLNTEIYASDCAANDDFTVKFENASVVSDGRILAGNLGFTLKPNKLTVLSDGNTGAVLKAAAGVCFDVTGVRTIGGVPYPSAGNKIIDKTVFLDGQGIRQGSVLDNIRDFDKSVPSSEVYRAARKLGLTDVIMKSLGSFNFRIAENGGNVSPSVTTGITLCRLLIKKPSLVFIAKEALPSDSGIVSGMLKALVGNGITVVTDKSLPDADEIVHLSKQKSGGKRND